MKKIILACVAAAALAAPATAASFIGSWTVDSGPSWGPSSLAYTGQEAAALIFGGPASKYRISTIDSNPLNIDQLSWVSTWGGACSGGFPCGTKVAQNFKVSTAGGYLNVGDTSAYVRDWAVGAQYTNFAFAVPEPASWALMIVGFGLTGAAMRRRRVAVAA
jgi:hypothetical protein